MWSGSENCKMIRLNVRNTFGMLVALFFVYLIYLIWFKYDDQMPEFEVDLVDVIGYAALAVEMGGNAVKKVYEENQLNIREKGNTDVGKAELLTKADLVSNHLISDLLKRFPLIKVVSEEKEDELSEKEVEKYKDDNYNLWLNIRNAIKSMPQRKYDLNRLGIWIDPLDATQEFTEGLLEYVTVMACITLDGEPIFGAINRPFFNHAVFGLTGYGLVDSAGNNITVPPLDKTGKKIVVSRSHTGKVKEIAESAFGGEYTVEPAGGAGYKTLRVLNGTAAFYVHTTAIKKWDVCAADALMRAANGKLMDLEGQLLLYQDRSTALNKNGLMTGFTCLMVAYLPITTCEIAKKYLQLDDFMTVQHKNQLALRRIHLMNDYMNLMKAVEGGLDQYRLLMSKSKNIIGFSTASALSVDNREIEPTKRVDIKEDVFEITNTTSKSERPFAPFGIFEPMVVKQARNTMSNLLPRLAELASVQKELRSIENELLG
ncbi:unnamed protein product [Bursaphelenchus okinawaensis]|uniref:inositol-phosphate phosphatase n=1 Tax=Bursaphelenchus okinawaensis TaxID=465554 RepID=A0A811JSE9_9BILA|nr:unnamed protein product [Bursaphelenchus okinawaensis]CAG9081501.1 unnamed protein product [Bursaphelenchus okinawaensis]